MRFFRFLLLAIRALLGYRTYTVDFPCGCDECCGPNRIGRIPWRYRLNQPLFRSEDDPFSDLAISE
jgi:hypothetical protein